MNLEAAIFDLEMTELLEGDELVKHAHAITVYLQAFEDAKARTNLIDDEWVILDYENKQDHLGAVLPEGSQILLLKRSPFTGEGPGWSCLNFYGDPIRSIDGVQYDYRIPREAILNDF